MKKTIKKIALTLTTAATAVITAPMLAFAGGWDPTEEITTVSKDKMDAGTLLASILNIICYIAGFVGIIFIAVGTFQIIMGFRNDDGESKSRGGLQAGTGIALLSLGLIFKLIFT